MVFLPMILETHLFATALGLGGFAGFHTSILIAGEEFRMRKNCRVLKGITLPETNIAPEKWMVGILLSYWGGLFSGATLVSGRVYYPVMGIMINH